MVLERTMITLIAKNIETEHVILNDIEQDENLARSLRYAQIHEEARLRRLESIRHARQYDGQLANEWYTIIGEACELDMRIHGNTIMRIVRSIFPKDKYPDLCLDITFDDDKNRVFKRKYAKSKRDDLIFFKCSSSPIIFYVVASKTLHLNRLMIPIMYYFHYLIRRNEKTRKHPFFWRIELPKIHRKSKITVEYSCHTDMNLKSSEITIRHEGYTLTDLPNSTKQEKHDVKIERRELWVKNDINPLDNKFKIINKEEIKVNYVLDTVGIPISMEN